MSEPIGNGDYMDEIIIEDFRVSLHNHMLFVQPIEGKKLDTWRHPEPWGVYVTAKDTPEAKKKSHLEAMGEFWRKVKQSMEAK